jgi:hypothetical protein
MKILIKVTKDVLKRSAECGHGAGSNVGSNCAVAVAVLEIFPNAWVSHAWIHLHDVNYPTFGYATEHHAKHSIGLPPEASAFIALFDEAVPEERLKLDPISFEINVPDEVVSEIGIGEVYRILSESKTLELVIN